ncbi:hypothetical protein ND861_04740 [Leptospira sp. 2 VSF19]|uniref:Uncharacterized protein n=1 Tax=Leptospira soteropolitanensis TaxID=2950025 RepID=A0AAW5VIR7_9LEPT|nr:hypothetical protein [Leptospira soteropolitanensis]MCW7491958.1 hypothetical protein [Leptospira soteropolitanensis]MCW7499541.1 hypothetical protein [Leptospira soteropolitanensis]MCW7520868.1 hypothetical protein [Leptospira soteropolitanensis]MCW7525645.1 hypothetical protein [Leptospira soteropolitanensis]MCW7529511.1 hypothetical protein [Leptospira soteropolitanensis]
MHSLEILVEVEGKEHRFSTILHWNRPPYHLGDFVADGFFALVIGLVLLVMGIGFW